MSTFKLDLVESELKILLEGLTELENKMESICDSSKDEDEISEYGNDLIEVRLLLKPLREKAVAQYGEQIMNFSRQTL